MIDENSRDVSMLVDVNYPNDRCNSEKRIFYIDISKLPKKKHEEYMKSLIKKYRNK